MQKKNVTKQTVSAVQQKKMDQGKSPKLSWWQLSLIGVGSVIGAGFFLGTGLSIHSAGPSVLIGYLLAGLTAFFVFHALAEMTVRDPQAGSFRTYAGQAFGHVMGFTSGWVYWTAGVLIMSSEVTALSIFTQLWFSSVPLWIFAIIYSVLALGINLFGVKKFGTVESFFAVIKLATLIIFIAFITLVISGVIHPGKEVTEGWSYAFKDGLFTNGFTGLWSALIFILFSYGGIEMLGVLSNELRHPKEIPLAGRSLVLVLTALYIGSIFLIISVVSWTKISEDKSPFVEALSKFHIPYLDSIFNVILISAAFSTMVGALFSITSIMISLAKDGDAPARFQKKNKKGVAIGALLLSGAGLGVTVILSFFLPDTVYEYMTTAAGIMLILNWMIILASHIKKKRQLDDESDSSYFSTPFASYIGIFLILFSIGGALLHHNQRVGFYISIGFVVIIQIAFRVGSRFGYFQKVHKSEEEY